MDTSHLVAKAKFGAKGKNKFWYGFKKHISVDMQSGLINRVSLTSANITDDNGLKHVVPSMDAIYADKGYCDKQTHTDIKRRGRTLWAILKNNMKNKNSGRDILSRKCVVHMSGYSLKLIIKQGIKVLLKISLPCLWSHWLLILKE
nr:transposase [Bathymodiolus thermophilus thioautotrophic gill symbiont]